MSQSISLENQQSSPASFTTAKEPESFPFSLSFSGFSDFSGCEDTASPPSSVPLPSSSTSQPFEALTPPPEYDSKGGKMSFTSLEAATLYLQTWARDHGYRIRRCRLKKKGKQTIIIRAYFECEYAGEPRIIKIPLSFRIRKNTF